MHGLDAILKGYKKVQSLYFFLGRAIGRWYLRIAHELCTLGFFKHLASGGDEELKAENTGFQMEWETLVTCSLTDELG